MLRKRSSLIEEREKKNKKIIYTRTVTVYICTVTIHLHSHGVYLHIFTQIDEGAFWVKMCKIEHILHFTHFSTTDVVALRGNKKTRGTMLPRGVGDSLVRGNKKTRETSSIYMSYY